MCEYASACHMCTCVCNPAYLQSLDRPELAIPVQRLTADREPSRTSLPVCQDQESEGKSCIEASEADFRPTQTRTGMKNPAGETGIDSDNRPGWDTCQRVVVLSSSSLGVKISASRLDTKRPANPSHGPADASGPGPPVGNVSDSDRDAPVLPSSANRRLGRQITVDVDMLPVPVRRVCDRGTCGLRLASTRTTGWDKHGSGAGSESDGSARTPSSLEGAMLLNSCRIMASFQTSDHGASNDRGQADSRQVPCALVRALRVPCVCPIA